MSFDPDKTIIEIAMEEGFNRRQARALESLVILALMSMGEDASPEERQAFYKEAVAQLPEDSIFHDDDDGDLVEVD